MSYRLLAILLFFVQTICAQVSHQFRNTPLIDAIRTIEQGQTEYTVSILSDGLTHLTTSARIEEEDALRAIKSLCKGLGVKVKEKNGNINVQAKASLKDMPPYYFLSQVRDGFTNAKIGGVNVYLMNEDSVVLDSCKSNSSGSFSIKVRREWKLKSCIIKITSTGYRTHYSSHSLRYVGKTQFHRVPDLFMKKRNTLTERTLDELTVKATKVKMYYKGDTLVYNADAFNLANGSMLDDLIRQMPGVELTRQGEVFVNGRKVENLLLNGKDFFKGNHQIILENLPYYTVRNIKVYEQTTEKALALGDESARKDYVMDVILKKEYSKGYMGNVEAGGGTEKSYLARLFGLRFTDVSRLAVVGGANNLNMSSYSFNGNYNYYNSRDGRADRQLLAAELLTDNRRKKNVLTLQFDRKRPEQGCDEFAEIYHNEASTFSTSQTRNVSRNLGATVSNTYTLKMPFWMEGTTKLHISSSRDNNEERYYESGADTRQQGIEVLDSLFNIGVAINDPSIIMARKRMQSSRTRSYGVSQDIAFAKNVFHSDIIDVSAGVDYNQGKHSAERFDNYLKWQTELSQRDITETILRPNSHIGARVDLSYKTSRLLYNTTLKFYAGYRFNRDNDRETITDVASSMVDDENSYKRQMTENRYTAGVDYYYDHRNQEKKLRTEIQLDLPLSFIDRSTKYTRYTVDTCLRQRPLFYEPSLTVTYSKWRGQILNNTSWKVQFSSSLTHNLPEVTQLIDLPLTSDRINIYKGNANLKSPMTWKSCLYWKFPFSMDMDLKYNMYFNRIVNSYSYDSGVYTYMPMNVDGTWDVSLSSGGSLSFKLPLLNQDNKFTWKLNTSLRRMKNYIFDGTTGKQSLINNDELYTNVPLSLWGMYKNVEYTLSAGIGWRRPLGSMSNVDYRNALEYTAGLWISAPIVAGIYIDTDFELVKRQGYSGEDLNKLACQWDVTLSKSVWKNKIDLRLTAIDLLRQHKSITYVMNEQGIRETRSVTLPSYFLFTIGCKFSKQPKKRT